MALAAESLMTVDEYLAFERESEQRHEFVGGAVVAMGGGSRAHNRIAVNILSSLHAQTRRSGRCRPYMADMRLRVADSGLCTYPDLFVTCGDERTEEDGLVLVDATLIVEVLSPTTEGYDRGEKWARYRRLESLRDYLLVAQDRAQVERFSFAQKGEWTFTETADLDMVLDLASIGCRLGLSDIYADVFTDEVSGDE